MKTFQQLKLKTISAVTSALKERGLWTVLLLSCLLVISSEVGAQKKRAASKPKADQGGHSHTHTPSKVTGSQPAPKAEFSIPDVEVLDQNGHKRKFYTDLVKGKVVVINFIYTSCKAVCPMSGANFSKLQTLLAERLGQDVHLISVTTDPETDSPPTLKAWSEKFKPKAGWTLVTGNKKEMSDLLQALTGDGPRTGYHVPAVCLVNDKQGVQRSAYGLEAPARLVKMIDELSKQPVQ